MVPEVRISVGGLVPSGGPRAEAVPCLCPPLQAAAPWLEAPSSVPRCPTLLPPPHHPTTTQGPCDYTDPTQMLCRPASSIPSMALNLPGRTTKCFHGFWGLGCGHLWRSEWPWGRCEPWAGRAECLGPLVVVRPRAGLVLPVGPPPPGPGSGLGLHGRLEPHFLLAVPGELLGLNCCAL